jgi:hypothetical protein
MSAITVTYDEVRALRLCESGLKSAAKQLGGVAAWNAKPATFADLRAAGVPYLDLKWLTWALAKDSEDVKRHLRLWLADCAAHVLYIYEKKGKSTAPRKAIIAARARARGEISAAAAAAAAADAADAADAAYTAAAAAADAAYTYTYAAAAAAAAAVDAAYTAAYTAAAAAAYTAAYTAAAAAADAAYAAAADAAAARSTEYGWQLDRLVVWFSDQEPEDWPLPEVSSV